MTESFKLPIGVEIDWLATPDTTKLVQYQIVISGIKQSEKAGSCTCDGCWACKGREVGCTCDVDWDEIHERNMGQRD